MITIQGDKVDAFKCKPETGDGCNEKELEYISKIKSTKTTEEISKELNRLKSMFTSKMKPDLQAWLNRRVYILKQMTITKADNGDNKEEL